MSTAAEEFFDEIFMRRVVDDWTTIQSFRLVAKAGVPAARAVLPGQNIRPLQALLDDPENARVFIGDPSTRGESIALLAHTIAEQTIANAQASIDAASVVFAHSALDGAAYDCCVVTAKIAPDDWE